MISNWSWTNGEMTKRQGVEDACRITGSFNRCWLSTTCVSCTAQENEWSHRSWCDWGFKNKKKYSRRGQVKTLKNGRFDQCVMYCYCEILLDWRRSSFGFFLNIIGKNHDELFGQRQYIEHCVISSFPLRISALFLFLISLEVEIHKSEVGTSCRSDWQRPPAEPGCWHVAEWVTHSATNHPTENASKTCWKTVVQMILVLSS